MKPRITVITLGVRNLERALAFYRDGLKLPTEGIIGTEFEDGAVVFFRLSGGLILALYPTGSLGRDAKLLIAQPPVGPFSIGHNVATRDEVDQVIAEARAAGGQIHEEPRERAWGGYSGYFQDPDGHLWEVAWNPSLGLDLD